MFPPAARHHTTWVTKNHHEASAPRDDLVTDVQLRIAAFHTFQIPAPTHLDGSPWSIIPLRHNNH